MTVGRRVVGVAVCTLVLALTACGGDPSAPTEDELAGQEPEEALAEMPGVADVGREYDVEEDEFYVNEVVVDAEPDVTVDELVAIMDVMSYYEREGAEEPVNGTIYRDAGTTEWDPTAQHTQLVNEPASAEDQRARAEVFLTADDELDQAIAVIEEDSLIATSTSPVAVAETAARIRAGDLGEIASIALYLNDGSSSALSLTLDPEVADGNLAAYTAVISAPLRGKTELESLSVRSLDEGSEASELAACLRLSTFNTPKAEDLTPEAYGKQVEPVARALITGYEELGGSGSTLELRAYVDAPGQYISCEPLIRIDGGEVRPDKLGRGWDELAGKILSGPGSAGR